MITLKIHKKVPSYIKRVVKDLCDKLPTLIDIKHEICIDIAPTPNVVVDNIDEIQMGFGYFDVNEKVLHIGGSPGQLRLKLSKKDNIKLVVDTIFHEMKHYCQFRDKKPITERGVEKFATSMTRKYLNKS